MICVVPLAGPDFERSDGATKAELIVDGMPLLRRTLESRSWWRRGELTSKDLIFVLRDTPVSRDFHDRVLDDWYPDSKTVFVGGETGGAAFSALAGVALAPPDEALCVDLVDILYREDVFPQKAFMASSDLGGIALTFASDLSIYSYLRTDPAGVVVEAAEKRVISNNASAGTYLFRNSAVFIAAVAHSMRNHALYAVNGRLFVCPLFNGVLDEGMKVDLCPVSEVRDIKLPAQSQAENDE